MAGKKTKEPKLLSGGNPQIPKGDGDGPVQDYIAAMPGWKRDVGRQLDDIVVKAVPKVQKAVKWNTPLYGMENPYWFFGFHCFNKYVKVTFFNGGSLKPKPPEKSKYDHIRYFHIHEGEEIDVKQFTEWLKQASKLPGEKM